LEAATTAIQGVSWKYGSVRCWSNPGSFLRTKGPIAASPANDEILSALAVHDLAAVLTLPIVLMNRVVAILYLGNRIDMQTHRLIELQRLAVKAALSFEVLILRNKILLS